MANHIQQLLNTWYEQRDELEWILATIIDTEGSSYRKPGAMMMINSLGQYHGLLSGGCLESDIMRQSRQCWDSNKNRIIQYDMREEEDIAWQLGIGCGGLVRILLQPVSTKNNYLQLVELREAINQNQSCKYIQALGEDAPFNQLKIVFDDDSASFDKKKSSSVTSQVFEHLIKPSLNLAIFGGGIDAIPVAKIAASLGWHVNVADPRTGYAREAQFPDARHIEKASFENLSKYTWLQHIDAIVIMTHNLKLDAQALSLAQQSAARYVGMLGPIHRTDRVLKEAGLIRLGSDKQTSHSENVNQTILKKPLANPIGLRLGGELPESIALSILAEIHAYMEQKDAKSISDILS
jgi:xanthine/CO dehydrogenase XdhC/CoxF family maturation factor